VTLIDNAGWYSEAKGTRRLMGLCVFIYTRVHGEGENGLSKKKYGKMQEDYGVSEAFDLEGNM
jgi:hypothetical protein